MLNYPRAVAVHQNGDVYIADTDNYRVRLVKSSTGKISTLAGTGSPGFNGDGNATKSQLQFPKGIAVLFNGDAIVADTSNHRIRQVSNSTGNISTMVGTGSCGFNGNLLSASTAQLCSPYGVATTSNGGVLIADTSNQFIRFVPQTLSTTTTTPSFTPSPTPTINCAPTLYRSLPHTDLVGTLTGNAWYPGTAVPSFSEAGCRQACCDAPICDAYSFASNDLLFAIQHSLSPVTASCFLYTNVTALVPSSAFSSGALLSSYS